jgi:hypothetical protein
MNKFIILSSLNIKNILTIFNSDKKLKLREGRGGGGEVAL